MGDVAGHVRHNTPSDLISTTTAHRRGEQFINNGHGQTAHFNEHPVYIYQIDPRGLPEVHDVNKIIADKEYANELEITVRGGIPPENIISARVVFYSKKSDHKPINTGDIIPNPHYRHYDAFIEEEEEREANRAATSLQQGFTETHKKQNDDDDDDKKPSYQPKFVSLEEFDAYDQRRKSNKENSKNPNQISVKEGTNFSRTAPTIPPMLPLPRIPIPQPKIDAELANLNNVGTPAVFAQDLNNVGTPVVVAAKVNNAGGIGVLLLVKVYLKVSILLKRLLK